MSRTDLSFDNEYPPGLGYTHRSLDRDQRFSAAQQPHTHSSGAPTGAPQQDRRASAPLSSSSWDAYGADGRYPHTLHVRGYDSLIAEAMAGPNSTNIYNYSSNSSSLQHALSFPYHSNHNHRAASPPLPASTTPTAAIYPSSSPSERDSLYLHRPLHAAPAQNANQTQTAPAANSLAIRSTLWWGDLEPWMDEEYAKQVCGLMNWEPASIKIPHPAPDSTTGQQANNPGYCFLTFPSPAHAASVLAQISKSPNSSGGSLQMPNSTKPFVMNWASAVTSSTSPLSSAFPAAVGAQPAASAGAQQQYPKEYSIFVGDLAPETSNSDLVAVFRNPILGLRNDREPKFIKPFLSCKSAKIMLDPVTGVSRGYGFVRFTDEADQQRALIEMHGLYCLSRPMRISPATAKFKPPQTLPSFELPQVSFTPPAANLGASSDASGQPVTIALPLPSAAQAKSVSAPIAAAGSSLSLTSTAASNSASSGSSFGGSNSNNSLSSGTSSSGSISTSAYTSSSDDMLGMPLPNTTTTTMTSRLAPARSRYFDATYPLDTSPLKMASMVDPYEHEAQLRQVLAQQAADPHPRYVISEESWKHHAQARAILGNLIGPNGEQLTSTDPYNTTVFVGGLSPLISEETLRTFFSPFGDIHYVKVPVGKHCGFVQFVRKADAERAIEKMQGFPIGGSRIRLSWGRSQYKAAQAAAQAAQAAALQSQFSLPPLPPLPVNANSNANANANSISHDQALQILHKFSQQGYFGGSGGGGSPGGANGLGGLGGMYDANGNGNGSGDLEGSLFGYAGALPGLDKEDGLQGPGQLQGQGQGQGQPGSGVTSSYTHGHPTAGGATQRPDIHRTHSNFSPFSPDPNNLYMSSESTGVRREASPFSSRLERLERVERVDGHGLPLPHPSKAYAPGFFSFGQQVVGQQGLHSQQQLQHSQHSQQQQDLKVNTNTNAIVNNPTGKVSPTSASASAGSIGRPGSGGASASARYGFGDSSDPPTPLHRPTQAVPISRPSSGQMGAGAVARPGSGSGVTQGAVGISQGQENDPIHDLNGTLASLELDLDRERPLSSTSSWTTKTGDVTSAGKRAGH